MFSIIVLPSNFVASTTQVASEFFTDLAPVTLLICGVLLAVVVVELIIGSLRK